MKCLSCLLAVCLFLVSVCHGKVHILDESNWDQMLGGEWMVEFYAPWCPACRALEPVWKDFASWSDDLGIKVGQVDVTTSPGLSGRFMVTALPTIYHVKNGVFRQYRGTRDKDEFISFVEEKKYEQVEPIPNWKAPSSIQMSVVSSFFKLSMMLRNIHTQITEEHGIPNWGSYLIFALATIVIGAILGLVLVFIIDCFYPNKASPKKSEPATSEADIQQDGEDIVDSESEVIVDDTDRDQGESEQEESEKEVEEEATPERSKDESEAVEPVPSSPDVRKRRTRRAD